MKRIIVLMLSLFLVKMAMGQIENPKHMFEFNVDSVLQGAFSFDKTKLRGSSSDNDTQMKLDLNYAYTLMGMRNVQLGARTNYWKDTSASQGDFENYGFQVGGIWNFSMTVNDVNIMDAMYMSLYLGLGWNNNYSGRNRKDELMTSTLSLGRRYPLLPWGLKHVVYSPEVTLQSRNSTTGEQLEYAQSFQVRFLQFSVFF